MRLLELHSRYPEKCSHEALRRLGKTVETVYDLALFHDTNRGVQLGFGMQVFAGSRGGHGDWFFCCRLDFVGWGAGAFWGCSVSSFGLWGGEEDALTMRLVECRDRAHSSANGFWSGRRSRSFRFCRTQRIRTAGIYTGI